MRHRALAKQRGFRTRVLTTSATAAVLLTLVCIAALMVCYIVQTTTSITIGIHLGDNTFLGLAIILSAVLVAASYGRSSLIKRSITPPDLPKTTPGDDIPRYGLMAFTPEFRRGKLHLAPPPGTGVWSGNSVVGAARSATDGSILGVRSTTDLHDLRTANQAAHTLVMVVRLEPPIQTEDGDHDQYSPIVTPEEVWVREGTNVAEAIDTWLAQHPGCRRAHTIEALLDPYPGLQVGDEALPERRYLYALTHPFAAGTRQRRARRAALLAAALSLGLGLLTAALAVYIWWLLGAQQRIDLGALFGAVSALATYVSVRRTRQLDDRYGRMLREEVSRADR